ncbi:MAG: tetratricopeptide repeat protein, partial [Candidatus Omnitrophica bacterium]|nr:tetratricopeptide repeat protein [Candidatus Omnitrophota bacterium]
MMLMSAPISLVIINENERFYLPRLFASLGPWRTELDIVFADHGSFDDSIAVARRHGIEKIVSFSQETNLPALFNRSLEQCQAEFVLFAHSDVIFSDSFFPNLQKLLQNDPAPDWIDSKVLYVDKCAGGENRVWFDHKTKQIRLQGLWESAPDGGREMICCSSACFIVRKELCAANRFNEDYARGLFVEDLALRLVGQKIFKIQAENLLVEHYHVELHKQKKTQCEDLQRFRTQHVSLIHEFEVERLEQQIRQFELITGQQQQTLHEQKTIAAQQQAALEQQQAQIAALQQPLSAAMPLMRELLLRLDKEKVSEDVVLAIADLCRCFSLRREAERLSRRALEQDPGNEAALCGVAEAELEQKRYKEAKALLMRILSRDPFHARAKELMYALLDQVRDAQNAMRKPGDKRRRSRQEQVKTAMRDVGVLFDAEFYRNRDR